MFGAEGLSQRLPVPLFLIVSFFLALICISRVFLFFFFFVVARFVSFPVTLEVQQAS